MASKKTKKDKHNKGENKKASKAHKEVERSKKTKSKEVKSKKIKSKKSTSKEIRAREIKSKEKLYPKFNSKSLYIAGGITLFTLLCFYTAIDNEFVNWDDDRNFYDNEIVTNFNVSNFWSQTKAIFTSDVIGGYNPLTIFSFALDKIFYGLDNPMPWHLENVLLHLLCTFFVFFIGRKLGLSILGASFFALLFGVHPMRVESVAWVTERKDVLFGVFYLSAMFYYLKYVTEDRKKRYMVIISICFGLSLLSKIQAVIFPVSMVLIDYYVEGKIDFKKILKKAPFFIASIFIGLLNIKFLNEYGTLKSTTEYGGIQRIFIGSWQYTVYLIKSIVPYRLSPLYPYPSSIQWYFYPSFLSFIVTGILLVFAYLKNWRVLFFGLSFFFVNVFLLLQIVGAGQGFLADRFTYIAYIGLFFMYSYLFEQAIERFPKFKNVILGLAALLIGVYGFMTFNQNKIWKNSGTLWSHVLQYYQRSVLPYGNRANYYRDNGETEKALKDYGSRIRLKADDAAVFNSRGRLYFNFNARDSLLKALNDYNKAIELKPTDHEYWANRGATYAKLNDLQNALTNMNESIRLNPNYGNAYLNRSVIKNGMGDYRGALDDIDNYLKFNPYAYSIMYEKGRFHNILKEPQKALPALNTAIKNDPSKGIYFVEKSKAELMLGNVPQAKSDIQKAKQLGAKVSPDLENTIMSQ